MTLVLVVAFNISVALVLGFVFGRIYQIRSDELGRRVEPPPVARIPQPWLWEWAGATLGSEVAQQGWGAKGLRAHAAKLPELLGGKP
jgi:hypothetical protein